MNKIRALASSLHYISLKFGTLSLTTEKKKGEQIEKTTILLPKKIQSPASLEAYVSAQLKI
jgi:hypothetical protein